ncbi:tetratricopeptide repeat protein [Methanocaldococcus fervens]
MIKIFSHAWNNKGVAFARLERFEEAVKCFEKLLQIDKIFMTPLLIYINI